MEIEKARFGNIDRAVASIGRRRGAEEEREDSRQQHVPVSHQLMSNAAARTLLLAKAHGFLAALWRCTSGDTGEL